MTILVGPVQGGSGGGFVPSDIIDPSVIDGQIVTYDTTTEKFIPSTFGAKIGGSNAITQQLPADPINVSGSDQTVVVPDDCTVIAANVDNATLTLDFGDPSQLDLDTIKGCFVYCNPSNGGVIRFSLGGGYFWINNSQTTFDVTSMTTCDTRLYSATNGTGGILQIVPLSPIDSVIPSGLQNGETLRYDTSTMKYEGTGDINTDSEVDFGSKIVRCNTVVTEAGSVEVGPALVLEERGGYLQNKSNVTGKDFISVEYEVDDTGTLPPTYDSRGPNLPRQIFQPDEADNLLNVTSFTFNTVVAADVGKGYLKFINPVDNFRLRVIADTTGEDIKYFPSENDWRKGTGVSFPAGENIITFETPLAVEAASSITIEVAADQSVDLLGDLLEGLPWIAFDTQFIVPVNILTQDNISNSVQDNQVVTYDNTSEQFIPSEIGATIGDSIVVTQDVDRVVINATEGQVIPYSSLGVRTTIIADGVDCTVDFGDPSTYVGVDESKKFDVYLKPINNGTITLGLGTSLSWEDYNIQNIPVSEPFRSLIELYSDLYIASGIPQLHPTRRKTEMRWSGLTGVTLIDGVGQNLISFLESLPTPDYGSFAPYLNTVTDKLNVYNANASVHFKLDLDGSFGGFFGNRRIVVDFLGTDNTLVNNQAADFGDQKVNATTFLSIDKDGNIATNGSEMTLTAEGADYTINSVLIVIEQVTNSTEINMV